MNPTFGDKVEGAHYQTRYGVYAVIPNQEKTKIILVQAPNGAWFLPGGEIEAGEDHYSALERELRASWKTAQDCHAKRARARARRLHCYR